MAGTAGSTFCSELNRLANGGTYPLLSVYLDDQGAANKWAGTTGLAVQGALNAKLGITDKKLFKGIRAACNALAGTTDKSPTDALRGIDS
jgi:hypothetical protein